MYVRVWHVLYACACVIWCLFVLPHYLWKRWDLDTVRWPFPGNVSPFFASLDNVINLMHIIEKSFIFSMGIL